MGKLRKCYNCPSNKYPDIDGKCLTCGDFYLVNDDQTGCKLSTCKNINDILLPDSSCKACAKHMYPDLLRRDCLTCPDYKIINLDGTGCMDVVCNTGNILLTDGTCKPCDQCSTVSKDGYTCEAKTCLAREILTIGGVC